MTTGTSRRFDDGYVATMVALLIIPLVLIAGLAVDLGGWYLQSRDMQNAADAAALAAAGLLPQEADAIAAGLDLAADNGYRDQADNTTVTITIVSPTKARADISRPAMTFLASALTNLGFTITRSATAAHLPPLHFESPTNLLGFGPNRIDSLEPSNFWLHENNDCQKVAFGDIRAGARLDDPTCGGGAVPNPFWKNAGTGRERGYFYQVTIPPGLAVSSDFYVFDPGACPAGLATQWASLSPPPKDGVDPDPRRTTVLSFVQWSDGAHPGRDDDFPISGPWHSDACYPEGWVKTPFSFPPNPGPEPVVHLIQTLASGDLEGNTNNYSLLVAPRNGSVGCDAIVNPTCPTLAAEDWIPLRPTGGTESVSLYLTRVSPDYKGKHLLIDAYDLGERMYSVTIRDPNGKALDFTWNTDDHAYGVDVPANRCGSEPCLLLDPSRDNYPPAHPWPGWIPDWKFNGRIVTFDVPIDSQFDFDAYPNYWVSLDYAPSESERLHDLASFRISVSGAPTRLVE